MYHSQSRTKQKQKGNEFLNRLVVNDEPWRTLDENVSSVRLAASGFQNLHIQDEGHRGRRSARDLIADGLEVRVELKLINVSNIPRRSVVLVDRMLRRHPRYFRHGEQTGVSIKELDGR